MRGKRVLEERLVRFRLRDSRTRPGAWLVGLSILTGLLLVGLLASLAACGADPTSTPAPTPLPTNTPRPTDTPQPTATPTPTVTPTATPVPLADWVEEGYASLRQSDYEAAEAHFQRAIEADASYAPAYVGLSQVYHWQLGLESEALAQAEKATELAPDSAEAHAALARAWLPQLASGAAVEAGEQAVKLDAGSAVAQAVLARVYLVDRQYDAALEAAEEAVALDPELAEGFFSLAGVHAGTADFARAEAAFEKAVALEPEFVVWHRALSDLWRSQADYGRAEAALQQALELAPDDAAVLESQAFLALKQRDLQAAEAYARQLIELLPEARQGYMALGFTYAEMDEPDEALAQFREAMDRDLGTWHGQRGIASIHLHEGECDLAARQAEELSAAQPRIAEGQIMMGWAKLCQRDMGKALEYFRKAEGLEPYNAEIYTGMGYAYAAQGRVEEAQESIANALRLSPNGAEPHTQFGRFYEGQGEVDPAEAEYEAALRLDPVDLGAHIGLGRVGLAGGDDEEGLAHAEAALSMDEKDIDSRVLAGRGYVELDRPEEAVAILEELVEDEPEIPDAHYFLGLAYRDMGRFSDAQKALETYAALAPMGLRTEQATGLIDALEHGYLLSEEKAIDDLTELLSNYLQIEAQIGIEETESGDRALALVLAPEPGGEEGDEEDVILRLALTAAASSYVAPRIDPPVEGGVVVRIEEDGKPLYAMEIEMDSIQGFVDGLISVDEFTSSFDYSRSSTGQTIASAKEIEADLSTTRELTPTLDVPFNPLTSEDLERYLTDSMDAEAREAMKVDDSLLTILGIIGPEVDLETLMTGLYAEQVAGFYDSEEKALYVIEDDEQSTLDELTIAHEYVHSLQDQHFGLDVLDQEEMDADQRRAFRALVEGDATLGMILYASEHVAMFDLLDAISGAVGLESEVLESSPDFIQEMELFPYERGLEFVAALFESGGWEAVDEAYKDPPQSTEQILHPERYREREAPETVVLPDLAAALGSGWEATDSDVMGELGLRLTLAEYLGPGTASLAAEGWAGDRYALYQQAGTDAPLLVMHTYWDDEGEAGQFWDLFRVYMDHRAGYDQDVRELVGPLDSRWWLSESGAIVAQYNDRYVTVIIGPDAETIEPALKAMTD